MSEEAQVSFKDKKQFTKEDLLNLKEKCFHSAPIRERIYKRYRDYYFNGSYAGKATVNKIFGEVNNYLSLIYSPTEVIIEPQFEPDVSSDLDFIIYKLADVVEYELDKNKMNFQFSKMLKMALIDGTAVVKLEYKEGVKWTYIKPENFGVLYEDLDLDSREQIIGHKTFVTKRYLEKYFPDVARKASKTIEKEEDNKLIALFSPDASQPKSPLTEESEAQTTGRVYKDTDDEDYTYSKNGEIVYPAYELYYYNNGWNVSIIVADTILTTKKISIVPFMLITPIENPLSFWGISLVSVIEKIQEKRNDVLNNIDNTVELTTNPPLVVTGYQMTEEMIREEADNLREPNGISIIQGQNIKVDPYIPRLNIPDAFNQLDWYDMQTKFITGINEILMGQAQKNVRSGQYASMLAQFASTDVKVIAENVESQYEELITTTAKIIQHESTTSYKQVIQGKVYTYTFSMYPNDYRLKVYAHTSSPITTEQNMKLIISLMQAGIIPADVGIKVLPLPYKKKIEEYIKIKEAQQAQQQAQQAQQAQKEQSKKASENEHKKSKKEVI
ncbi:MAG: hypothetical protein QXI16_04995 [Sulfolobaceae archaeon]